MPATSKPDTTKPRTTKKDIIVAALRDRIDRGELKRGEWVRQDSLAEDFSTSITPVREALRELQAEGVLVGHAHRGVQVAEADLDDVKGTYMLRRVIEPYAMQRAAMRLNPTELLRAERLIDAMEAADPETYEITELNREFHFLFYDRSGPPSFVAEITRLWDDFPWDLLRVARERVPRSIAEHREMLAAVQARDLDAIAATTANHVLGGYRALRAHLSTEGDGAAGVSVAGDDEDPFDLLVD